MKYSRDVQISDSVFRRKSYVLSTEGILRRVHDLFTHKAYIAHHSLSDVGTGIHHRLSSAGTDIRSNPDFVLDARGMH